MPRSNCGMSLVGRPDDVQPPFEGLLSMLTSSFESPHTRVCSPVFFRQPAARGACCDDAPQLADKAGF